MAAERPLFDAQESAELRRRVGTIAREALDTLAEELQEARGRRGLGVSETWAKKFKTIADQIRRDFRLDGETPLADEPPPAATEAKDPLARLRVVAEDEEVA